MAKFVMEDGSTISGDHLMDMMEKNNQPDISYHNTFLTYHEIEKLKIPNGISNRHRMSNLNTYDLLTHIQQSLLLNNRCILKLITNEEHRCLKMNDDIQRRINQFANKFIDDDFRKRYPRNKLRIKDENHEESYTTRMESDEEWNDRLCHLIMHLNHPTKLQMIKCEECIQSWLNSSEW